MSDKTLCEPLQEATNEADTPEPVTAVLDGTAADRPASGAGYQEAKELKSQREHRIVRASIMAIIGNMVLVAGKLAVGFMANSIAIILDAVNNATDALSSIITIVGTKLAGHRPTRKHPFGFGRIEYLTSVVIAVIILVAGALSLRESIEKIINPAVTNYTAVTIGVIIFSILMKIVIGIYLNRRGKANNSQALIASGVDSNYDAVLSAGTLVVAGAQLGFGINIDGAVGLIISLVVLKAGIEVLADALGPIIGEREDDDTDREIREYVRSFPGVLGAYDLVLDNFGPNEVMGAIHIEVDDNMTAARVSELTRAITLGIYQRLGIIMTVGIYASNSTGKYAGMRKDLDEIAAEFPEILQVHGFYVDDAAKRVYFDLVIDFKTDENEIRTKVVSEMKRRYPKYTFSVIIDTDYEGIAAA